MTFEERLKAALNALMEDAAEPGVWTGVVKGPRKGATHRPTRGGASGPAPKKQKKKKDTEEKDD